MAYFTFPEKPEKSSYFADNIHLDKGNLSTFSESGHPSTTCLNVAAPLREPLLCSTYLRGCQLGAPAAR